MEAILMLVALPLLVLNLLAGLAGGVGLAFQGEWGLLFGGLAYGVGGPFLLSLAMLPGMIFLPLTVWAGDRGNTLLAVMAAIPNMVWTYVVVAVSCIVAFAMVTTRSEGDFFHLLWGYSVATAPWSFIAQKEKQSGNDNSTILMFFVQMGTVSMMVAAFVDPYDTSPARLATWFLPFMGLGLLAQLFIAWVERRNARHGRY